MEGDFMDIYAEYKKKILTAAEAAELVQSDDWVDYSQCCSFPTDFDRALADPKD